MVSSQLCPSSFHNQSYTGSETRDFGSRVVMDGTILNSLCLLIHIGQSIQPYLSNGTSTAIALVGETNSKFSSKIFYTDFHFWAIPI